jgi:hypothetical protein
MWLLTLLAAPALRSFPRLRHSSLGRQLIETISRHPQAASLKFVASQWSGFRHSIGGPLAGQFIAIRSDGVHFYVCAVRQERPPHDFLPPWDARIKMAEFLTCRCQVGKPCLKHELEGL